MPHHNRSANALLLLAAAVVALVLIAEGQPVNAQFVALATGALLLLWVVIRAAYRIPQSDQYVIEHQDGESSVLTSTRSAMLPEAQNYDVEDYHLYDIPTRQTIQLHEQEHISKN